MEGLMVAFREVCMEACMVDRVEERWERRWEEGMGHHLEEHRTCKFQHYLFHDRYHKMSSKCFMEVLV